MNNTDSASFSERELVSIIVPNPDVRGSLEIRCDQTWPNCEIVQVESGNSNGVTHCDSQRRLGISDLINEGVESCKGKFISILLPGTSYRPDKISKQIEFISRFDLGEAVIFCNYFVVCDRSVREKNVILPSLDPSMVFSKLYSGLRLNYSSCLFPRYIFDEFGPLKPNRESSALLEFCMRISREVPFVGMSDSLVFAPHDRLSRAERKCLKQIYLDFQPAFKSFNMSSNGQQRYFLSMGEAFVARVVERSLAAALDNMKITLKAALHTSKKLSSLICYLSAITRCTYAYLPLSAKHYFRRLRRRDVSNSSTKLNFATIYRKNGFAGTESLSGAGSTLFQTREIRMKLPGLLQHLHAESLLDIPCGDFHWMRHVDLSGIKYIGADVVPELVYKNSLKYTGNSREFRTLDLISGSLPKVDLLFCRDCLVHLPFDDCLRALATIRKSDSKWLLTTSFIRLKSNMELDSAGWRPLNLTLFPFCLPEPEYILDEKCTEGGGVAEDKALCLWRIADL